MTMFFKTGLRWMYGRTLCFLWICPLVLISGCDWLVNYLAFHPEPDVSVDRGFSDPSLREIQFESVDGVKLQAYYFSRPSTDRVVLFLHGNAGNAAQRLPLAQKLADLGANVFLLSYRGYGKSEGSPSEEGLYRDAKSALAYLEQRLGFSKVRTIIFARSIGTAVAIEVAQGEPFAGLILISPPTSGLEMARHLSLSWMSWMVGNRFNSAEKISDVMAPVLIIHGEDDDIVPLSMGKTLFKLCVSPKQFHVVPGAGHNDIIFRAGQDFWVWVRTFLDTVAPSDVRTKNLSAAEARMKYPDFCLLGSGMFFGVGAAHG